MDAETLRASIMRLATEMESRQKWEALRSQQMLSLMEKEASEKHLDLVEEQRARYDHRLFFYLRPSPPRPSSPSLNPRILPFTAVMKRC